MLVKTLLVLPVWFMLGGMASAMCIWFIPPTRQFTPATNMKTLVSQADNTVTMTVQPQFSGNALDFALVMPFPNEPRVEEAPEDIFVELEDLTNPELEQPRNEAILNDVLQRSGDEVTVIEERDVGDFSTVTLSANSASALETWLQNEGYEMTDAKREIVSEYVNNGGYFVALKVNMDEADVNSRGFITGELAPISFVFEAGEVGLPLRLMSGDNALVTLTVYTLSDEFTYLPGAEVQFSKKVDATQLKEAPSLESYNAWKKWLVRNIVQVDTSEITADVPLLTTEDTRVVVPGVDSVVLNPDELPIGTGIIVSESGRIVYTVEESEETTPGTLTYASNRITTSVVVILVVSNIVLLILLVASQNNKPNHPRQGR